MIVHRKCRALCRSQVLEQSRKVFPHTARDLRGRSGSFIGSDLIRASFDEKNRNPCIEFSDLRTDAADSVVECRDWVRGKLEMTSEAGDSPLPCQL